MRILTATAATQGTRDNDYDWTIEGELVLIQEPCARDRFDPDGGCGCGRGFAGLGSHRATTTAQVRDLPMTRDEVVQAFIGYYDSAGWGSFTPDEVGGEVDEMLEIAELWPVGTVIERRLDVLHPRTHESKRRR